MLQINQKVKFLMLAIIFLTACVLSLFFGGSGDITLHDLDSDNFVFWQIRFPKTITAIIAGSTLAVSGLILQIIFRNPLAGPYVLGISSGAALMVAITLLAGSSLHLLSDFYIGKSVIVLAAITGSLMVTLLI